MPVVLCPDTRRQSPEVARMGWWELAIGQAPTNAKGRAQGFGPVCFVLSGSCFLQGSLPVSLLGLSSFLAEDHTETFKTEQAALNRLEALLKSVPRGYLTLQDRSARTERTRVWRVG